MLEDTAKLVKGDVPILIFLARNYQKPPWNLHETSGFPSYVETVSGFDRIRRRLCTWPRMPSSSVVTMALASPTTSRKPAAWIRESLWWGQNSVGKWGKERSGAFGNYGKWQKMTMLYGKFHCKWSCPIAMLNYQMVYELALLHYLLHPTTIGSSKLRTSTTKNWRDGQGSTPNLDIFHKVVPLMSQ